jgi:transposase
MTKFPEVISTVQRRRGWSTEDKVAILDAAFRKGGSVAAAADRFGVSRGLIYVWRSQVREGLLPGVAMTDAGVSAFSAVAIARDAAPDVQALPPPSLAPLAAKSCRAQSFGAQSFGAQSFGAQSFAAKSCDNGHHSSTIEIRLVNGRTIKTHEGIAPDVLAGLVAALDGGEA